MSTNFIGGLQGSGKSFFCVRHIIDQLIETDRDIYTNIALHPDQVAKLVLNARYKNSGFFFAANYAPILNRIHMFVSFNTFKAARRFRERNPVYCDLHLHRDKSQDKFTGTSKKLIFHLSEILEFWNIARSNCLFYFDESYQFWKSSDGSKRDKDTKERREKLQTYILHHRHFDDDVYIISHQEEYLDKSILFTSRYIVRNMRQYPIIPEDVLAKYWWMRIFGSIKRPYQFFRTHVFIGKDKVYVTTKDIWPSVKLFKCYDSKAQAETLGKQITHNQDTATSGDYKISYFKDLKGWLRDSWTQLLIVGLGIWFFVAIIAALFSSELTSGLVKKAAGDKSDNKKAIQ